MRRLAGVLDNHNEGSFAGSYTMGRWGVLIGHVSVRFFGVGAVPSWVLNRSPSITTHSGNPAKETNQLPYRVVPLFVV